MEEKGVGRVCDTKVSVEMWVKIEADVSKH